MKKEQQFDFGKQVKVSFASFMFLNLLWFNFLQIGCNSTSTPQIITPAPVQNSQTAEMTSVSKDSERTIEQIIRATPPDLLRRQHCEPADEVEISSSGKFPPLRIWFDGSASTAQCGKIVKYQWNFGDGTSKTGARVAHTYTQAGNYSASLILTDNKGNKTLLPSQYQVMVSVKLFITGRITDTIGKGIDGVLVRIESEENAVSQTGKDGNFKFLKAASGSYYKITPMKAGYSFKPRDMAFTNLREDKITNFIGVQE